MKRIFYCIAVSVCLTACRKNEKKLIVYSKGVASIDKEAKSITVAPGGTSQEEKTLDYNSADKLSFNIQSPAGNASVDIAENGLYIINTKTDTIVGSYQVYGAPKATAQVITQEHIKKDIDSLQQLLKGANVNTANRNFFIAPNTAVKISGNIQAYIVGPFHQMTSIEKEEGKEPEVYRFFTANEIRETIAKLQKLTVAETAPSQK